MTMRSQKFTKVFLLTLFGYIQAIDPFEGFLEINCFEGRNISGCSGETLAEAYLKTAAAENDEIFSEPTTRAYLFTRRNKKNPESLHECAGRLPSNSLYRAKKKTQILVAGYLNSVCGIAYVQEVKEQLLYRADYNVIIIDWSWGNGLDYYSAVRNSQVVGKQIAFVIRNIMEQKGVAEDKFHLIGHSLGAHVVARTGAELNGKIRRITGLDPAGPAFKNTHLDNKLDPSDAQMVDIIHTNAGECLPHAFGELGPSGHADFYPNGGKEQINSFSTIIPRYLKGDIFSATACLYPSLCYHLQATEFFKVSINACFCQFIGVKCSSYEEFKLGGCRDCGKDGLQCAVMGMDYEYYPRAEGNHSYYLDTSLSCPFTDNSGINREGFPLTPVTEDILPHCFTPLPEV